MTLVTFVVMGVVLALLFVAAMVTVLLMNRKDRSDSLGSAATGQPGAYYGPQPQPGHPQQAPQAQPQQYGQPPQQYGPPPQGPPPQGPPQGR